MGPDNNDTDGNMFLFLTLLAIAIVGFIAASQWLP